MNAMNFTDVSDGLAAGMTAIAAGAFAVLVADRATSVVAIAVCAGALGFFVHNFPSGAVFLGDSGSLSLGFLVGALALEPGPPGDLSIAPLLVLAYPLFDVAFVIVSRWRRCVPIVQGGRDHTVHRLASRLGNMRVAVTLLLLGTLLTSLSAIWIA
jgi:UDP-GlcNAc:undecaprenyl-phosphate GlcNAc-1-phosphate transferase